MASNPPRFERTLTRQVGPINPAAGAEFGVLAAELERFNARRSAEQDRQAEESGFLAGQQAGAEGAAIDGNERTIRGRAFNRGVVLSHQAALQTDIRDNVARLEIEHDKDPDTFRAKVDGMVEGLMEEANPRLQPFIQQRAADYSGAAQSRIIARQTAELEAIAQADLQRGAEGLVEDAETAAFEGDVPMTEARRQELFTLLDEGVAGGIVDDGAAEEVKQEFERKVTSQEIVGEFDRLVRSQGPEAGSKAIQRWQATKPSSVGLSEDDHEAITRQLFTLKNRQEQLLGDSAAKNNAAVRAEHNTRTGRVNDAISVMRDGFSPDQEDAKQVAEDINWLLQTGDIGDIQKAQQLAEDHDVAQAIQGQVSRFRRMTAGQRATELERLENDLITGGASADEVDLLDTLKSADTSINQQLESDPLGYLNRIGLQDDPPLDFSSNGAFIESLVSRETSMASQLAGRPVGLLKAFEVDPLARLYESSEIAERVGLLASITAASPADAEATLAQIDSKGYPQMAMLGGFVLEGRGQLARDIMFGNQQLAANPKMKPAPSFYNTTLRTVTGSAWAESPEMRAQLENAAFAKYAQLKAESGDLSDTWNRGLFRDALNQVMPTAEFNGRRVAVPPGITENLFEDWTDGWSAEDFAGVTVGTPEEVLERTQDKGKLVELGNGRYGVMLNSAETGRDKPLTLEDGTKLVLQLPPR